MIERIGDIQAIVKPGSKSRFIGRVPLSIIVDATPRNTDESFDSLWEFECVGKGDVSASRVPINYPGLVAESQAKLLKV